MRFKAIQRVLGALIGMSSVIALPPMAIAWVLDEHTLGAFIDSAMVSAVLGGFLWFPVRNVDYDLRLRDGFFIVSATWWVVSLVTALPFVFGAPHLSYTDAVFEAASGLTTTGATMIVGLDVLPKSMLFYRQSLNFLGGMGIVILAVAILPMLKIGGTQLFRAESTGPTKDSKLTPRIAETAKALWIVYIALNVLCAVAYWLGGMDLFDAICHAMATLATGGFSTHDASFGYWDSSLLDSIATVFMLLGGINYGLHYMAWRRADAGLYFTDSETRAFFRIVAGAILLVTIAIWIGGDFATLGSSFRHAAFQVVSNITTTGFGTTGFDQWSSFTPLLLVLLAVVGGCSGSTAGGVKVARVLMVLRQGLREVRQLIHPKGQFLVKMGGRRVSERVVLSVGGFMSLYTVCFVGLVIMVNATGLDILSSFGAVIASIANLGPGLGVTASNFVGVNDMAVWLCTFAMILGRLEVFTVLVLLSPSFWRD
ncbi:MAG: potassium transporter [Rhodanobacteraceae bacterium]|nr:potassium transporter [Rhodanobacteraceae bacterium]HPF73337.1 TrkH family potassium uptake protein [Xanthomonadaceae bacterium]HRX98767.1 TrkH family potassium uptake protein [Xanthomonadaceae bacterium]